MTKREQECMYNDTGFDVFKNQLAEWKFHFTLPYCSWVKSHKTGTREGKKKSLTKRKGKMKRNKRKFQKKKKKHGKDQW